MLGLAVALLYSEGGGEIAQLVDLFSILFRTYIKAPLCIKQNIFTCFDFKVEFLNCYLFSNDAYIRLSVVIR